MPEYRPNFDETENIGHLKVKKMSGNFCSQGGWTPCHYRLSFDLIPDKLA